jgi:large subunit ribosomal protein L4
MAIKVFDGNGQSSSTLEAPAKLSASNAALTLVHQVMVAELNGKRQGTHKTKDRTEVAGSGVKIRRQKGTGRSRQGDKRTPHMRGGGVSHGPRPRDYSENTPRKMKQAAFRTALNSRLQNDLISVLDGVSLDAPRTKTIVALLASMQLSDKKVLFLVTRDENNLLLSARNIPKVDVRSVSQTGIVDVLKSEVILCTSAAWAEMTARVEGGAGKEEVAA